MTYTSDYAQVLQLLESRQLYIHIKCRLARLEPKPNVSEEDVLQYVILSLIETLKSGREVKKLIPWGKCVAGRYINKQYKLCRRSIKVDSSTLEFFDNNNRQQSASLDKCEIQYLHSQIALLRDCDRQIIEWRFFQNLSWYEIAERLSESGRLVKEEAARKRGQRALGALYKLYINGSAS